MLVILKPDKSIEVLDGWPENFMNFLKGSLVYDPEDPFTPWCEIGDSGWHSVGYTSLPAEAKAIQLIYSKG